MQSINDLGKLAASITAIIGLCVMLISFIKAINKLRRDISERLDGITDDIADLQYERLSQAHDFYMDRGWCPNSKKVQLCNMYASYTQKGRNHLSAHYEKEMMSLPDKPADE